MDDRRAILISIKPEWVEKILTGEKTIEIRKTIPDFTGSFKVYIYCSKGNQEKWLAGIKGKHESYKLNGTVCAEFTCEKIDKYEAEFVNDDCYEQINVVIPNDDDSDDPYFENIVTNEQDDPNDCWLCKESCVPYSELKDYIANGEEGFFVFYGWRISDLKVYDKPRSIGQLKPWRQTGEPCWWAQNGKMPKSCGACSRCYVQRPPQSWMYIVKPKDVEV